MLTVIISEEEVYSSFRQRMTWAKTPLMKPKDIKKCIYII